MLYYTILYYTILILYCTILYYTILYYTILYYHQSLLKHILYYPMIKQYHCTIPSDELEVQVRRAGNPGKVGHRYPTGAAIFVDTYTYTLQ